MGIYRENGYSAHVEGFFVHEGNRIRLAKTSGSDFVVVEPYELAPGTTGELVIIVDGDVDSRLVRLPDGAVSTGRYVRYEVVAPF